MANSSIFNWHQFIGLNAADKKQPTNDEIVDRLFHWLLRAEKMDNHESELYYKMEEMFDYLSSK